MNDGADHQTNRATNGWRMQMAMPGTVHAAEGFRSGASRQRRLNARCRPWLVATFALLIGCGDDPFPASNGIGGTANGLGGAGGADAAGAGGVSTGGVGAGGGVDAGGSGGAHPCEDWTEHTKLTAGDADPNDYLGWAVSLSGSTALVGAYGDDGGGTNSGAAYVFRQADANWIQEEKLLGNGVGAGDQMGRSVSLIAETALIGGVGTAHAFQRTNSAWNHLAHLAPLDVNLDFGSKVSSSVEHALVGAIDLDGSAYVFGTANWTQQQKILPSTEGGLFGAGMSISTDRALVGAPYEAAAGVAGGAVYVYVHSGGTWMQEEKLVSDDIAGSDAFGASVSLFGDLALVGAPKAAGTVYDGVGAAYMFERVAGSWVQRAKLVPDDEMPEAEFGWSVSLLGDTALVGAPGASGAAYLFERDGDDWVQLVKLVASGAPPVSAFGLSVSLGNGTAAVGDAADNDGRGAVYVFACSSGS